MTDEWRGDEERLSHTPPGEEGPKRLLEEGSVWIMVAAPSVWAAHFLMAYWTAAVWCAKVTDPSASFLSVRLGIAGMTVIALAIVAFLFWYAVRRYQGRLLIREHLTEDSEAERTRFLGHATLLLCSLSAVAIVFQAFPVLVFATCY